MKHSKQLNTAVDQLITFIQKSGFNDVSERNFPIVGEGSENELSFGLIDSEDMNNSMEGLIGRDRNTPGLIGCVTSEEQLKMFDKLSTKYPRVTEAVESRRKELQNYKILQEEYQKKGLKNGNEPIVIVDLSSLGLALTDTDCHTNEPLKDVIIEVIKND